MTRYQLHVRYMARCAEFIRHAWVQCVEILAVTVMELVMNGAALLAADVLQVQFGVGVDVAEAEISTGSPERLRKVDVEHCAVVKYGDWAGSVRDCLDGKLHCFIFCEARRIQAEFDGDPRSFLVRHDSQERDGLMRA